MKAFIDEFMNYLSVERGLAKNTLLAYRRDLNKYIDYLSPQGVKTAAQVKWLEAVVRQGVAPGGSGLLLHLPGGVRVELASNRQVPLAVSLIRALDKPC